MKNVTKILTAVVLCAAVFASTQRTDALGGNAAFWPGDEANIAAFPAQINNHGFVQVTNMSNGQVADDTGAMVDANASIGMVFSHGGSNWSLGFSDSADDFFNLGWGKDGMGVNVTYKMWSTASAITTPLVPEVPAVPNTLTWDGNGDAVADSCSGGTSDGSEADATACTAVGGTWGGGSAETFSCSDGLAATEAACDNGVALIPEVPAVWGSTTGMSGFGLSFGKDLGDWGEIGVHYKSGDGYGDGEAGMVINYTKSCGFWVFTDMVASLDNPDVGDMTLDIDMFGHMDAGAADVMFATGIEYDTADDGGMTLTSNLGVEAAVTDNVTVRGGMNWAYDLTNDGGNGADATGADATRYGWVTGAGINFGSFNADFDLGDGFWGNPLGWVSGEYDDAAWGNMTVTYSF